MSADRERKRIELCNKRIDLISIALGRLEKQGLLDDDFQFTMALAEYMTGNVKIDAQLADHASVSRALIQVAREVRKRLK